MQSTLRSLRGVARLSLPLALVMLLFALGSTAQDADESDFDPNTTTVKEISKTFGSTTKEVSTSPLSDFFTAELDNGRFIYATNDGQYALVGDLYGWSEDEKLINLTQRQKNASLLALFTSIPEDETINFAPEEVENPSIVYVFTDVDCGYCRLLHEHMAEYHANGIEIRYLAFPRAGIGSRAHSRLVSAWCSEDKHTALKRVKDGGTLKAEEYSDDGECSQPVQKHHELGQRVGISGTPTNVLPNGKIVPGFTQAEQLLSLIES